MRRVILVAICALAAPATASAQLLVRVPSVHGQRLLAAVQQVRGHHLRVGRITYATANGGVRVGDVISVAPRAGKLVRRGSFVRLVVRKVRLSPLWTGSNAFYVGPGQFVVNIDHSPIPPTGVVRADACWECSEPQPGIWDWSRDDAISAQVGSRWQPIIDYAPAWAGGGMPNQYSHLPPTKVEAYAQFAAALVARYHPAVVEIWNEPDIAIFWTNPKPQAYAALYSAAYHAIKAAASKTIILATGLEEWDSTWWVPAVASAGIVHPDGWAAHPYASNPQVMQWMLQQDERLLATDRLKAPIYVTEYGGYGGQAWGPVGLCPGYEAQALQLLRSDPNIIQADWFGCIP